MSFWERSQTGNKKIDQALKNENVTVENILLDEDFLNEIYSKNSKLLDFICKNFK